MTKTVTSLFQNEQQATAAATRLEQAGIPKAAIDIWSTPHNLAPLLEDDGVSRSDAYAYAEGVIRGGSVIIVKCDDAEVAKVVGILDQEGVQDLDERQEAWRADGFAGSSDRSRADADTAASGQPDGVRRVRVQPLRAVRPVEE